MSINFNEEAHKLGFADKEEMDLYHDVCGCDIIPTVDINELLKQSCDEKYGRTKDEFVEYVKANDLEDILKRVKNMSLFERYMELYNYNSSLLLLSDSQLKIYNKKNKETRELFDGEKEEEYSNKSRELFVKMNDYLKRMDDLQCCAAYKLDNEEQEKFYNYTEMIEEHIQDLKNYGRGKRK